MAEQQPSRVAVYLRHSTDKQEDSPERQRSVVEPYCEQQGYVVVGGEYLDRGIAGDEFSKRPEFQRLLRDAQAGLFQGIVVDHKDRLSRQDPVEYIEKVVAPLRRAGVWVESVANGRIDWNSMSGLLTDHILQHQAAAESPRIAYRTLTALVGKARRGQGVGGPVPYGYVMTYQTEIVDGEPRKVPDRYALGDPQHVEVVRWLFRTYAEQDVSIGWLRDELYRRGMPGPRGSRLWGKTTILRILNNRRYLGDWLYNREHCGKWAVLAAGKVEASEQRQTSGRHDEKDWVVKPDHHPAIIDRETFARVQAKLQNNRERRTPKVGGGDFLLRQMLVCGCCGCWFWGGMENGRRKYRCSGRGRYGPKHCKAGSAAEDVVLPALVRKLQEVFLNPEHLQALRDEVRRQEEEEKDPRAVDGFRRQLATLDGQIATGRRNLALLPADMLPGVVAQVREWEAERGRVAAELERLTNTSRVALLEEEIAVIESRLWQLRESMLTADPTLVRALLREMVAKVELRFDQNGPGGKARLIGGVIYTHGQDPEHTIDLDTVGSHRDQVYGVRIELTAADLQAA